MGRDRSAWSLKPINLFPYQIKNRSLYYDRDHDKISILERKPHWSRVIRKAVEGDWINDEGTWVHMLPLCSWHMNMFVGEVVADHKKKNKQISYLELTDREMIFSAYFTCCLGFSGYSGDEFFTSNYVVDLIERGEELDFVDSNSLDDNPEIYDKHGKMKKYVHPWDYLTKKYLIEEPQGKPLGKILYGNPMMDGMIFGARNSGKSMFTASHVVHELFTGGIREWTSLEDFLKEVKDNQVKINIGAADSGKLLDFGRICENFYNNMPGRLLKGGMNLPPPLYKRMVGSWTEPGTLLHKYVESKSKEEKGGSLFKLGIYTKSNLKVMVGGRRQGGVREEVGLIEDLETIIEAEDEIYRNKTDGIKMGPVFNLGTSGFLKYIKGVRSVFYGPEKYGIFSIPNYWENEKKRIPLFFPDYYVDRRYKDKQGNTIIDDAYKASVKKIDRLIELHASPQQIRDKELNNPNWPSQMFLDSVINALPSDLARMRMLYLEENGYYHVIGDLERDEQGKVVFKRNDKGIVLLYYNPKTTEVSKNNSWIQFEPPIKNAPKGLYRVTYDTVRSAGLGRTDDASLVSVIVKKGFDISGKGKQNTVVFRWTGRYADPDKNHEMAVMAAEYYGCQILHEEDVGDFPTYVKNKKKWRLMMSTPQYNSTLKVSGNALFNVGVKIGEDPELKAHLIQLFSTHLERELGYNENGVPIRGIDTYDDLLILDEIAQFGEGNFDNISAMLIHMLADKAEVEQVYGKEEKDGEKKTGNRSREMAHLAMTNLGYSGEYIAKFSNN